jgi:DNA-directed RNA polymerase III subunit RPC4
MIKVEDAGEVILNEEDVKSSRIKKERKKYVDREGFIRKLIMQESGRVDLDWGETRMLVGRGIPTGFLTTGVLVDPLEEDRRHADKRWGGAFGGGSLKPTHEGKTTGMGEIMGKFAVTPDWEGMMP